LNHLKSNFMSALTIEADTGQALNACVRMSGKRVKMPK
jgi:hypothetical protein